jgi:xylulokinase
MPLLGIDVGSSALKATVINEHNGLRVTRSVAYEEDWVGERPEFLERNVETYWQAFKQAIRAVLYDEHVAPESIEAVSFSVQGETFVVLDEHFRPLRKAIQGHDVRAQEEVSLVRARFGEERLYAISGQPGVDAYWPAVKLLWIKRNQPEVFSRIRRFLTLEGFILRKLVGRVVIDKSMIGDTYLYDISCGEWFLPIFEYLDLSPAIMPEVVQAGQPLGTVSREAASETGLSSQTMVVAGVMDQVAASFGAGNACPGIITETTGTALALGITGKGPLEQYLKLRLPIYYHAVPDAWFLMPWLGGGGYTLQWFKDAFAEFDKYFANKYRLDIYDLLLAEAAKVPPGSDGLIMLPFLTGANCPEFDTSARGVFFGIVPGHRKGHFVRAILEAIGYAIRANLELVRSAGIAAGQLRSIGNAAKSQLWSQIKADICGVTFRPMEVPDAGSLGAALLAGVGVGAYGSFKEAASSRFVQMGDLIEPDERNRNVYDQGFRKYREIYSRLKGCF